MAKIMEIITLINSVINDFVWGPVILILIFVTGAYYTIRLSFIQFRHPIYLFKNTVIKAFQKKDDHKPAPGELTSFQAAMLSVSGIVGSGNVAGVASALVVGGPGALFWMIVAAVFGMATKFAEICLGIKYRTIEEDGTVKGGTMYYLERGLHQRWLGVVFSIFVIAFAYITSAAIDSNTISLTLYDHFEVPTLFTGIVLALITGVIIFGGLKRIGHACEIIAPFMGIGYILAGVLVIILNINLLPSAIVNVIKSAFDPAAVTGGLVGSMFIALRQGFARGIFSNESGLGTAAITHSPAQVSHPIEQAMWGPVEVFLDTIIVCSITSLSIIMSGLWSEGKYDGASLTVAAFEKLLPGSIGKYIALGAVILFGFSCLISYYTCAERAVEYITRRSGKIAKLLIRVAWVAMIIIGSQTTLGLIWDIADTMSGLMIIPNLIAILFLSNEVIQLKKDFFQSRHTGSKKRRK